MKRRVLECHREGRHANVRAHGELCNRWRAVGGRCHSEIVQIKCISHAIAGISAKDIVVDIESNRSGVGVTSRDQRANVRADVGVVHMIPGAACCRWNGQLLKSSRDGTGSKSTGGASRDQIHFNITITPVFIFRGPGLDVDIKGQIRDYVERNLHRAVAPSPCAVEGAVKPALLAAAGERDRDIERAGAGTVLRIHVGIVGHGIARLRPRSEPPCRASQGEIRRVGPNGERVRPGIALDGQRTLADGAHQRQAEHGAENF
jgi:hypothetical protein